VRHHRLSDRRGKDERALANPVLAFCAPPTISEEAPSGAEHERMDHQHVLVDEIVGTSDWTRAPLPRMFRSPPGRAPSSPTPSAMSPLRSVEFGQGGGSARVVDAMYFGALFSACRKGLSGWVFHHYADAGISMFLAAYAGTPRRADRATSR
jgi:hypothetical protein